MPGLLTSLVHGAAAGAAGTTALNAATYLDMTLRGRPSSSTPETTVERIAGAAGAEVPGDDDSRSARLTALGALTGMVAGVGTGMALGLSRGLGLRPGAAGSTGLAMALAMLAGNGPMTVMGVTNPRTWRPADWAADVVPHLAYAVVTAATLEGLDRP